MWEAKKEVSCETYIYTIISPFVMLIFSSQCGYDHANAIIMIAVDQRRRKCQRQSLSLHERKNKNNTRTNSNSTFRRLHDAIIKEWKSKKPLEVRKRAIIIIIIIIISSSSSSSSTSSSSIKIWQGAFVTNVVFGGACITKDASFSKKWPTSFVCSSL